MTPDASRHDLGEAGQVALGYEAVHAASVYPYQPLDRPVLELTLTTTDTVPCAIAKELTARGVGIDVGESGVQGDHTTVIAY